MAPISARTLQDLHDVLHSFGVRATNIHDIRSGRVNKHWRVSAGTAEYALRRYNHHRSPNSIQFEHEVLQRLERKGWPVAAPVLSRRSQTLVNLLDRSYALFPFLVGRPSPVNSLRYLRIKGGLLARLQHDLASWPVGGQRDGFAPIWDLDGYIDGQTFDAVLDAFGHEQPELAEVIRGQRLANLQELASLNYESLPDTTIHGDFHTDNVLFRERRLSAILDFDLVHIDARVADIATSIAGDCPAPPTYMSIDPEAVGAFVGGYSAETPLGEFELKLIVPYVRAYFLWLCAFSLARWTEGDVDKATRSLTRSAMHRLPNLEARRDAIESALTIAAQ